MYCVFSSGAVKSLRLITRCCALYTNACILMQEFLHCPILSFWLFFPPVQMYMLRYIGCVPLHSNDIAPRGAEHNKCTTRSWTRIVKSIPLLLGGGERGGGGCNNLCPVVRAWCERYGGNLRHLAHVLAVQTLPRGVTKPDVPKGVDIAWGKNNNITARICAQ